jgi:CBS domain-containing protein
MPASVADIMTKRVISATESLPFADIAACMLEHQVSALPVVDAGNHVVGVVSEADLLVKEAAVADPGVWDSWLRGQRKTMATAEVAAELMSSPAVTVSPDTPVAEAARLMYARRVKRLPVVTADGRLVGIVSRIDVLSSFRRPDSQVRDDIVSAVAAGDPGSRPRDLQVSVEGGIVTLSGELDSDPAATALLREVRHVEGVVNVRGNFRFATEHPAGPGQQAPPYPG